jgi:hypothetical protein
MSSTAVVVESVIPTETLNPYIPDQNGLAAFPAIDLPTICRRWLIRAANTNGLGQRG